jgi:hypothetical protein
MPGGMQRVLIGTEGEIRHEYGSNDLVLYHKDSAETRILPLLADEPEGLAASIKSFTLGIDEFAREILDGKERNPRINETFKLFELLIAGLK